MNIVSELANSIVFYCGTGWYWLLWIASLIWLWKRKADGPYRDVILLFLILAAVMGNPLTGAVLLRLLEDSSQVYSRVFWLLMVEPVVAACAVDVVAWGFERRDREAKILSVLMFTAVLSAGAWLYEKNTVYYMDNRMEISGTAIAAGEYILANRTSEKDKTVAGEQLVSQIRQYDGTIRLYYGRRHEKKVEYFLELGGAELEKRLKHYEKRRVKFLIIQDREEYEPLLNKNGWTKQEIIGDHAVYVPPEE